VCEGSMTFDPEVPKAGARVSCELSSLLMLPLPVSVSITISPVAIPISVAISVSVTVPVMTTSSSFISPPTLTASASLSLLHGCLQLFFMHLAANRWRVPRLLDRLPLAKVPEHHHDQGGGLVGALEMLLDFAQVGLNVVAVVENLSGLS